MRLKSIRLSGFKSFVDPITIPISGSLIGVVGPNGCGKSNIIDAVRWVMGESSAKHLRGDSMADVIFNGSNSRKPVARASVELVFDNADGSVGGEYAGYSEISIRREAGRDGQSDYFLNKTRCRRKDITGIFLGTGLGPRAYSIIEQGMVTRIIEAKPEDLRGFIEEAAGISKYKERRRETENRIKHTRENLARVDDIRRELDAQLQRLHRQSRAAARYKDLKQKERLMKAQLLALRYRALDERLREQDGVLRRKQTEIDAALAAQREIEAAIELLRERQGQAAEAYNNVHQEFYSVGAEISRLEQAIEHARERREEQRREQEQLNRTWNDASRHLSLDLRRLEELSGRLEQIAPELGALKTADGEASDALRKAEAAMTAWQTQWDAFTAAAAEPEKLREIQSARSEQLHHYLRELEARVTRLNEEATSIEQELKAQGTEALARDAEALDARYRAKETELAETDRNIETARDRRESLNGKLDGLRAERHECEARLASLHELQTAAQGEHDSALVDWLKRQGLDQVPRLASQLSVEQGWERAVERVLGARLAAVPVSELVGIAEAAQSLTQSQLTLFDRAMGARGGERDGKPLLLDKVDAQLDLGPLFGRVFVAEKLEDALARRAELTDGETIITRDGAWVGRNWLSVGEEGGARSGWLERSREIETLESRREELAASVARCEQALQAVGSEAKALDQAREELRRALAAINHDRVAVHESLGRRQAQVDQLRARRARIERELEEIAAQRAKTDSEIARAQALLREAESSRESHEGRRRELQAERTRLNEALSAARKRGDEARERLHRIEIERQALQTEFDSTRNSITRLEGQLKHLSDRREELEKLLAVKERPEADLEARLNEFLEQRLEIEQRLSGARSAQTELDDQLRAQERRRHEQEGVVQGLREAMEGDKVARQELVVRRDTQVEQMRESGFELEAVLAEMPAEAEEQGWQEELERIAARIDRLGPINLVAIEEFEEQSKRKEYLDKQNEDLSQALATLEEAIRKMDRETRTRFKETFDQVNEGFKNFFPSLFGGGSAYLELTDNDLLETGVTVMARPPGKRNSTIHLLSGGEKALTAVALLFAIFELNPAPFCLLDEVDAPLDDANVERYCETIRTMSKRTQLVYVTHNKISMEMADILIGVTMSEPGVSRLVAVDVEEAMEMVAQ